MPETGTCESSPCAFSLVTPAGSGSYWFTDNEVSLGTYPTGRPVNIGSFYQSQATDVEGTDVPETYAYIHNAP